MASFGTPWLAATLALAVHVADEAAHDFLSWYNPRAARIRAKLGLPVPPSFSFPIWLAGLVAAVLGLAALTPWAYRGAIWLRPLAWFLAVLHLGNGLIHVGGTVRARRPVPGVLSAPFLLAAGGWLGFVLATGAR